MTTNRARITKRVVDGAPTPASGATDLWDTDIKGFHLRTVGSGRKFYRVRYLSAGRKRVFTIGEHGSPWTPNDARKKAESILREVSGGIDPNEEKQANRNALTVADLIDTYLTQGPLSKPNKRASSWAVDTYNLARHVRPLLGKKAVAALKAGDLERWQAAVALGKTAIDERTGWRGRARVTGGAGAAAKAMRCLAAMFAWAVAKELIPENPALKVERFKDGRRERYLSQDEAGAIWRSVGELEREGRLTASQAACFKLLMLTGARRGEIVGLRWTEVDLNRKLLLLPPLRHKAGATSHPKAIGLSDEAVDIVSRIPRLSQYVFPAAGLNTPMAPPKKPWAKVLARAEVSDASFHILRHTLASFAVADGVSLYAVGKMLGHAKPETTARYAHLRDDVSNLALGRVATRYTEPAPPRIAADDAA